MNKTEVRIPKISNIPSQNTVSTPQLLFNEFTPHKKEKSDQYEVIWKILNLVQACAERTEKGFKSEFIFQKIKAAPNIKNSLLQYEKWAMESREKNLDKWKLGLDFFCFHDSKFHFANRKFIFS